MVAAGIGTRQLKLLGGKAVKKKKQVKPRQTFLAARI